MIATPEVAAQVLELRLAGASYEAIAERLDFADAAAVEAVMNAALSRVNPQFSTALEADRLDRMHMAIWPKAARGDLPAMDRALKISERREKLLAEPAPNDHALRVAFDESAGTSTTLEPVDAALLEAGRKIADRVDTAVASGDGVEVTKALYLLPHMVNVLREMLATPASRNAAGLVVTAPKEGKLAQLKLAQSADRSG